MSISKSVFLWLTRSVLGGAGFLGLYLAGAYHPPPLPLDRSADVYRRSGGLSHFISLA